MFLVDFLEVGDAGLEGQHNDRGRRRTSLICPIYTCVGIFLNSRNGNWQQPTLICGIRNSICTPPPPDLRQLPVKCTQYSIDLLSADPSTPQVLGLIAKLHAAQLYRMYCSDGKLLKIGIRWNVLLEQQEYTVYISQIGNKMKGAHNR